MKKVLIAIVFGVVLLGFSANSLAADPPVGGNSYTPVQGEYK